MRAPMWWVVATTAGYALGMTLSVAIVETARPVGPVLGGMIFIALFGAVVGIGVGTAQLFAVPRRTVSVRVWLWATVVGAAAGFAVAAVVGEYLGNVVSPTGNIVIGGGIIQITSGAVVGVGIAFAQWRVLRPQVDRGWVVAGAIGTGLGWGAAAAVLELLEVPILKMNLIPAFGAIVGILTGLAQVAVLWSRRPNPRIGLE